MLYFFIEGLIEDNFKKTFKQSVRSKQFDLSYKKLTESSQIWFQIWFDRSDFENEKEPQYSQLLRLQIKRQSKYFVKQLLNYTNCKLINFFIVNQSPIDWSQLIPDFASKRSIQIYSCVMGDEALEHMEVFEEGNFAQQQYFLEGNTQRSAIGFICRICNLKIILFQIRDCPIQFMVDGQICNIWEWSRIKCQWANLSWLTLSNSFSNEALKFFAKIHNKKLNTFFIHNIYQKSKKKVNQSSIPIIVKVSVKKFIQIQQEFLSYVCI